MIGDIIRLLQADKYKYVSEDVEIAKGKYQLIMGWKMFVRKLKRL